MKTFFVIESNYCWWLQVEFMEFNCKNVISHYCSILFFQKCIPTEHYRSHNCSSKYSTSQQVGRFHFIQIKFIFEYDTNECDIFRFVQVKHKNITIETLRNTENKINQHKIKNGYFCAQTNYSFKESIGARIPHNIKSDNTVNKFWYSF